MRPGDRLICALVEPQAIGYRFAQWPLHITIVPWFRVDLTGSELARALAEAYVGSHSFEVRVGAETHLGYKQRKQVNLVKAPMLQRLEGQTRRLLHAHKAWIVDEADKTRREFRPHVTVQGNNRLHAGHVFDCDRLFIIGQHGDYKAIEAAVKL